jgi:hypothetical protein
MVSVNKGIHLYRISARAWSIWWDPLVSVLIEIGPIMLCESCCFPGDIVWVKDNVGVVVVLQICKDVEYLLVSIPYVYTLNVRT